MQTKNRSLLILSLLAVIIPVTLCMTACDKLNTLAKKDSPSEEAPSKTKKTPTDSTAAIKKAQPPLEQEKDSTTSPKKTAHIPEKPAKPTPRRKPSLTELPVEAPVSLPLEREITDSAGRKINVTITARYESEIALVRKGDSKTFNFPIEKLSKEDSAFVLKFPVSEKPPELNPILAKEMELIERRKKDIAKIRKDIASASITTSQKRGLMRREKELRELNDLAEKEIKKHLQK